MDIREKHALFVLCNTIVERVAHVDDQFLQKFHAKKGDSIYIDNPVTIQRIEQHLKNVRVASGGSGANTAYGVANLGMPVSFAGTIGNDHNTRVFQESFAKVGVRTKFEQLQKEHGIVYILITPDKQRTFIVVRGASYDYHTDNIPTEDICEAKCFHTTGYALSFPSDTILKTIDVAKQQQIPISLDLSSPITIKENRERIEAVLPHVDILFVSDVEGEEFGFTDQSIMAHMQHKYNIKTILYKMGDKGAYLRHEDKETFIPPHKVDVKSESGAGDAFAAGFLYGVTRQLSPERAAHIGSFYAAQVVQHGPSRLPHNIENIEEYMEHP